MNGNLHFLAKHELSLFWVFMVVLTFMCGCKDETKVKGISLNPTEITMSIGETRQIELLIDPVSSAIYNAKYWSSNDQSVAVVDDQGNVTAVYVGTCVITATVGDYKATCTVTVEAPEYDLRMSKGTVYITGVESETGALSQVLRLYDDGLEMDEHGTVTGNGLMIHLALCSPATTDTLSEGRYTVQEGNREGSVKPGKLESSGGRSYITGSFLGQYTDNGLSVLLLTGGEVVIGRDGKGEYSVSCDMEGELKEQVRVVWSGTPVRYKEDSVEDATWISYSEIETKDTVIDGETATRHTYVRLSDGVRSVEMVFRLPLSSVGGLLAGRYMMSGEDVSYTISEEASFLMEGGETIGIQTATIIVKVVGDQYELSGSLKSQEGKEYVIERCGKKDKKTQSIGWKIQEKLLNLQPNYEQ